MAEVDYLGTVTGWQVPDKFERTGLKAVKSQFVNAPIIEGSPLVIECELVEIVNGTNFTTVLARIVNIAAEESVLNAQGRIDALKTGMILYDSFSASYITTHEDLAHSAGLIMLSHAYFDFFAERKAAEEPMVKMAKAMGVADATTGKDFVKALDALIQSVGCADLKMSDYGITEEELKTYPQRVHEVLGGDITADPLKLSDEDYWEIFTASYK